MKKRAIQLGASAFVIATFVIYSFHQRSEGSQAASQVAANTTPPTGSSTPTATSAPITSTPATTTPASASSSSYKDGSYTGKSTDAVYGFIQVKATISGGKITDVAFLDYPQDRRDSIEINQQAMPLLKQQAIAKQSAQVDGVSGATDTSDAFMTSLNDALTQART
jgi:uncharacterized protein with FMN-binding domain